MSRDWIFHLIVAFVISALAVIVVGDHLRLIQVRQSMKDHGTPIEMDR